MLEVEISREKVPIRNGYRHVGQRARVRVNSGVEYELQGARHAVLCKVIGVPIKQWAQLSGEPIKVTGKRAPVSA